MKKVWAFIKKEAANPAVRPAEIWAFRAVAAYVAVKLGISVDHSVTNG